LVVVNDRSKTSPPRPAPPERRTRADNTLRNGYAAIAHSISGETAAIGAGFLAAGTAGAIAAGAVAPFALAAVMWRARRKEDERSSNGPAFRTGSGGMSGSGSGGGSGRSPSRGSGGSSARKGSGVGGPLGSGSWSGGSGRKPKIKDPVADKASKLGKHLAGKITPNRGDSAGKGLKAGLSDGIKGFKGDGKRFKDTADKNATGKGAKGSRDGSKGLFKDRGKQPDSKRWWRDRDDKPNKGKSGRGRHRANNGGPSHSSGRDGLSPRPPKPKGTPGAGNSYDEPEIVDGEIVDDPYPPKPDRDPYDVVDGEVVDDEGRALSRRIAQVQDKRANDRKRAAIKAGKRAAREAARDKTGDDPRQVKRAVTREQTKHAIAETKRERRLIALAAREETSRRMIVNYPAAQSAPAPLVAVRRTGAMVRKIDYRASGSFHILRNVADVLMRGIRPGEDADMADHIVELSGIPDMCKNLGYSITEVADILHKTAPINADVIRCLEQAAVSARVAQMMADNITTVFVQVHRDDIARVLDPRIGEYRWNLSGEPGTLNAAKLRAALASAGAARAAIPSGRSGTDRNARSGGKIVAEGKTGAEKLLTVIKDLHKAHMIDTISEIYGAGMGVNEVASAIEVLYKRMSDTWATERAVDEVVRRTGAHVRAVGRNLQRAVDIAYKRHQKDIRRNENPRKSARAEAAGWDVGRN
jgi:hypothetical protein